MKPLCTALLLAALTTVPAAAQDRNEDVPVVTNPATPPGGVRTVELEEIWRLGGDDSDVLLGLPTGLGWDAAGRVYVLDAQLNQVHVVAPDGAVLETRFREGDGPGEIRNPSDLVVWPDGSLGVVQEFPGQIVRLAADGSPGAILHPGGPTDEGGWGVLMTGAARGAQGVVVCGQMTKQDDAGQPQQRRYLAGFDGEGHLESVMLEETAAPRDRTGPPAETDMLRPYMTAWDVGPDGRTVTYERDGTGNITRVTTTENGTVSVVADSIGYLPFGPLEEMTLGNGLAQSRGYDQRYRAASRQITGLQDLTYSPSYNYRTAQLSHTISFNF